MTKQPIGDEHLGIYASKKEGTFRGVVGKVVKMGNEYYLEYFDKSFAGVYFLDDLEIVDERIE